MRLTQTTAAVEDPDAFCFRLAYNLATDRLRAEARRRSRESRWGAETSTFVAGCPVLAHPSAEEALASRRELDQVMAAVERLPPRTREVFRLHKLAGASYAETASRLGVSVSAVEKHMMRALAALARAVGR